MRVLKIVERHNVHGPSSLKRRPIPQPAQFVVARGKIGVRQIQFQGLLISELDHRDRNLLLIADERPFARPIQVFPRRSRHVDRQRGLLRSRDEIRVANVDRRRGHIRHSARPDISSSGVRRQRRLLAAQIDAGLGTVQRLREGSAELRVGECDRAQIEQHRCSAGS